MMIPSIIGDPNIPQQKNAADTLYPEAKGLKGEPVAGDDDSPIEVPFDNEDDWKKFDETLKGRMPGGAKYQMKTGPSGTKGGRKIEVDFPNTDEGKADLEVWNKWMRKKFPDAGGMDVKFPWSVGADGSRVPGVTRRVMWLEPKTGM